MQTEMPSASAGVSAAVSGLVALVGELVQAKAIDGRAAENVRDTMLRAVTNFPTEPSGKQELTDSINRLFDWSLSDGKGGKLG